MNKTAEILELLSGILYFAFLGWTYVLFYLSIRKCFWKGDKSRFRLFLVTVFVNPFSIWLVTTVTGPAALLKLIVNGYIKVGSQTVRDQIVTAVMFLSSIVFLALVFLVSGLIAKWLDSPNRELMTYVFLMHSVLISLYLRGDVKGEDSSLAALINIIGVAVMFAASILLYCLVIKALADLNDKRREIDVKLFVCPPTVFIILYNVFSLAVYFYTKEHPFKEGAYLILVFSTAFLFLFIWAFYVIIKNINATNEAIEAKEIATRMEIEEARIEADLSVAKSIQLSALPYTFPPFPDRNDFELFANMNAAKEVGGDFYDFYMLGQDTLGFLIADVSGKGIPAAMLMMTGKTIIKGLAENRQSPAEVFTVANEKLCEGNDAELFITAWIGFLDLKTGMVHVANAGHNPPVLIRDGKAEYVILKPGLMLAGMDGTAYKDQTLQLQKNDILYLYTDGVTEAMDADENQYGEDRLLELLSFGDRYPAPAGDNGIAGAICELVKEDIDNFVKGAEQSDDITMLCIRFLGES